MILEARERVGGRLLNHELDAGGVVEVGGQWVGPGQRRVNELIDELGLQRFRTHDDGHNLFEYRGRLSRYRGAIPRLNPVVLADIAQAQARLGRMARQVPLDEPWTAPRAAAWDAQTVATWISRNTRTRGAREFFLLACEAGLGLAARRAVAAALSLLRALRRRARLADLDRRRRPAGSRRRRVGADGGAIREPRENGGDLFQRADDFFAFGHGSRAERAGRRPG